MGHRRGGQLRETRWWRLQYLGGRVRLGLGMPVPENGDKGLGRQNNGLVRGGRVWRTAQEIEQVLEKWKKKNELLGVMKSCPSNS